MLYRLEGEPDVSGLPLPFTDVSAGKWYESAVKWAYAKGVVDGMSPTVFSPEGMLTREQFATILYRYAGKVKGLDVSAGTSLSGYEDADEVSAWAFPAMSWANDRGFIRGITSTSLSPRTGVTRAQSATVMMRFMK